MYVKCAHCNADHDITPSRMSDIIGAFQAGEMQSIGPRGLVTKCLNSAGGVPRRDRSASKARTTFSE